MMEAKRKLVGSRTEAHQNRGKGLGHRQNVTKQSFPILFTRVFGKDTESGEITSQEQASYLMFMRKPEVIKMHLDILYKSINFLNNHKIDVILQDYKHQKIQKQKEEEERMKM